jgi:hypothetical protein
MFVVVSSVIKMEHNMTEGVKVVMHVTMAIPGGVSTVKRSVTTETMFTGLFSRTTGLTTTAILSMLTKII